MEKKMNSSRASRKIAKSSAELARIQELREKYKCRPTPEELLASGDYTSPVPLGEYLKIKQLMHQLKEAGQGQAELGRLGPAHCHRSRLSQQVGKHAAGEHDSPNRVAHHR